jgi:hypothetical protein
MLRQGKRIGNQDGNGRFCCVVRFSSRIPGEPLELPSFKALGEPRYAVSNRFVDMSVFRRVAGIEQVEFFAS